MKVLWLIAALVGLIVNVSVADASTITFVTPTGATTSGGPVDASATFTTGAGTLSITLTDLQANPTDVAQLISDLSFTLSSGQTTGTLASSSTTQITVNTGGTTTLGSTGSTGWGLVSGSLKLDARGLIGPAGLIIGRPGPGDLYSNANGSIAANGPHNPFSDLSATFLLDIAGLTATDTVTSAIFSFGTTDGIDVTGVPSTATPLPGAFPLLATGLGALGLLGWRRKRKAQAVL